MAATILDDGQAGFSETGDWWTAGGLGLGGTERYAPAGDGSMTARWDFAVRPGATYRVATTWGASTAGAADAPFTVLDGPTARATVRLDERQAPAGFDADGATWQDLGTFTATGGTLSVRLSNAASSGSAFADAVRLEQISDTTASVVTIAATAPNTFTVTRDGDLTEDLTVSYDVGGTATPGVDYEALPGYIIIPAGVASATIAVQPLADAAPDPGGTVELMLKDGLGYRLGAAGGASLTIGDGGTGGGGGEATQSDFDIQVYGETYGYVDLYKLLRSEHYQEIYGNGFYDAEVVVTGPPQHGDAGVSPPPPPRLLF